MCDDFTLLLNKKLQAIIEKYKDVDDTMDASVDLETQIVYAPEEEISEPEEVIIKPHIKEFNRIYNLKFIVDDFHDLYDLLFNSL